MVTGSQASTSANAFSFISRGWREVRDSADADLQLMKDRADSFKILTTSLDRELDNFFNSSPTFPLPAIRYSTPREIDFVKRLRPKISEFRRTYSPPDFSKKVLKKWGPRSRIGIDLSAIRSAIGSEVEDGERISDFDRVRLGERLTFREFCGEWKGERENEKAQSTRDWEPVRALKKRLREFEKRSSSVNIFEGFKNSEFMEKVKSNMKSIGKELQDSKEVPPLDVPELLACLVRQSKPLLDQLGFQRGVCDKIVESLCSKRRNLLLFHAFSSEDTSDNINDEFSSRIASVLQSTGHSYDGGFWTDNAKYERLNGERHVAIVTTASLPWMTGTAVNPLFRAAYLAGFAKQNVTLVVPWLCKSDQEIVYPNGISFNFPEEQEIYIHKWLEERIGFKANFQISFYPGKFSKERRSIIPAGDTSKFISSKNADIAILEEPEHLNWYHHGKRWTDKFNHVVGIVHTNYLEYIKREKYGALQAFLVKHINNWVSRAYCHKVIRLSAATQDLPKSVICNVHGVNPTFLRIGEKFGEDRELGHQAFSKGAYFLGKMVWAKGYRELLDLLTEHKNDLDGFNLDVFGNGEDAHEVQSVATRLKLNVNFLKGRDHADDSLHGYKVFINPSMSDVLCTATAEALAMGKFVVCADHPSNQFFMSFPNCLTYKTSEDFVAKVKEAMENEPLPLSPEQRYNLSWEAVHRDSWSFLSLTEF